MIEYPGSRIGQPQLVTVWVMFFLLDQHSLGETGADFLGLPDAPVVPAIFWTASSDDCYCGQCWPTSRSSCPNLARAARMQMRQQRELYADRDIRIDRFEVPAYLTSGGRLHEVAKRIIARHQAASAVADEVNGDTREDGDSDHNDGLT